MKVFPLPTTRTTVSTTDTSETLPYCHDKHQPCTNTTPSQDKRFALSRNEEFLTPEPTVLDSEEELPTKNRDDDDINNHRIKSSIMETTTKPCPHEHGFQKRKSPQVKSFSLSRLKPKRMQKEKSNRASTFPGPAEKEHRRTIRFDSVTLREYGMIMGDNPSCDDGLPLTIDWDYVEFQPQSVDEYETQHAHRRRPLKELELSFGKRKSIILASLIDTNQPTTTTTTTEKQSILSVVKNLFWRMKRESQ